MSLSDKIALTSLVFTVITTVCVLFLSYAALAQTARPNITARLLSSHRLSCGIESTHVFALVNKGHWYGSPMAVDVTVYCNFPRAFSLRELKYGSVQEHVSIEVKAGVGDVRYLKAKGLKLSRHEKGEEVHVIAVAPATPGQYRVRLAAHSSNNASFSEEFEFICSNPAPAVSIDQNHPLPPAL